MNIFSWWRQETTKDYLALIQNDDAWAALLKDDAKHHDTKWWQYVIGYSGVLLFCVGSIIGVIGLFGK
jgi:predicted branched-subunit amino acid permease